MKHIRNKQVATMNGDNERGEWIRSRLSEDNPDAILYDECDDALMGIAERCGQPSLAVYSHPKLVASFMKRGMSHEDACEWVGFNIQGGWLGPHTPIVVVTEGW